MLWDQFFLTTITEDLYLHIVQQFVALLRKDDCDVVSRHGNEHPRGSKYSMSFLEEFFSV